MELATALHYVFDAQDRVIWDVSHQAIPQDHHRAAGPHALRQGRASVSPSSESEYDPLARRVIDLDRPVSAWRWRAPDGGDSNVIAVIMTAR